MFHFKQVSKIPAFHLSLKQNIVSPTRCFSATDIKQLRESENFTFDWKKVKSTPDEEREDLIKFKEMFKIDEDFQQEHQRRQYVVSKDPTEWSFVERLISQTKPKTVPVPKVSAGEETPSGFQMPSAKPGDHPYHVRRTASWMLPVYVDQPWRNGQPAAVRTTIRKVEGDVSALRNELSQFLFERYEQEFISQPNELMQKIVFRGNFDADFKEFLKEKGF